MRAAIAAAPALAGELVTPAPAPLLAPHAAAALGAEGAEGLDLILEGFLLHHREARLVAIADRDRRVVTGDYCYARGLTLVAAAGDAYPVAALAELISVAASLAVDPANDASVIALWTATVAAIAAPADAAIRSELAAAIARARGGDAAPLAALAATLAPIAGLAEALRR